MVTPATNVRSHQYYVTHRFKCFNFKRTRELLDKAATCNTPLSKWTLSIVLKTHTPQYIQTTFRKLLTWERTSCVYSEVFQGDRKSHFTQWLFLNFDFNQNWNEYTVYTLKPTNTFHHILCGKNASHVHLWVLLHKFKCSSIHGYWTYYRVHGFMWKKTLMFIFTHICRVGAGVVHS
jgi:hypothetical protein